MDSLTLAGLDGNAGGGSGESCNSTATGLEKFAQLFGLQSLYVHTQFHYLQSQNF